MPQTLLSPNDAAEPLDRQNCQAQVRGLGDRGPIELQLLYELQVQPFPKRSGVDEVLDVQA
jgi:hypothetical protein